MNELLTVIVPLYNQEKWIRQCIESLIQINELMLKIIIVDDGSTDNSYAICKEVIDECGCDNITVIRQENRGLADARMIGIKNAQTKYITFVDADDFVTEDAYCESLCHMQNDTDEIFYEITRYYSESDIRREYHIIDEGIYDRKRIVEEIFPKLIWDFDRNVPGMECSQCVRIVKKELLLKAYERLNNKSFYYGEDIAITFPIFNDIRSLAVISKSYYMHRQREANGVPPYIASKKYFDEVSALYKYLRNCMDSGEYDFNRQIDYMYIHSVNLKKWMYGDLKIHRDFLFPFNKVEYGKKVILYGAGQVGQIYYDQLKKLAYCEEILWVDRNAMNIDNLPVNSVDELFTARARLFDYIVIAIENINVKKEIKTFLLSIGYKADIVI